MTLPEKLAQAENLLTEHSHIEKKTSLTRFVKSLNTALDNFLKNCEPEIYRATPEYVELTALFDLHENRTILTKQWFDRKANLVKISFARMPTKTQKQNLAVELVRNNHANLIIDELKITPKQRLKNLLGELANLNVEDATEKITAMKAADFKDFCEANDIAIEKTKRGAVDKRKTLPNALKKVDNLRDYMKM
ncbi:MAG: hypothetical protein H7Z37_07805 [Pyrinomonadaceae bacterium]|nr:hypothetical protein [Pyrinomonadaceae bacterium]